MSATVSGFHYPVATDTPDVPRDIAALATDVEAKLGQLVASGPAAPWIPYTPTLAGSGGTALGNGTIGGRARRVGNTGDFDAWWTFGTTSVIGTSSQQISMPSGWAAYAAPSRRSAGIARYFDASTGNEYVGQTIVFDSGSTIFFGVIGASGLFVPVTNTNPFGAAFATGDKIIICGRGIELYS